MIKTASEYLSDELNKIGTGNLDPFTKEVMTIAAEDAIRCSIKDAKKENQIGEWQKCPKCDGQGIVSKPPYVAGDQEGWLSTSTVFQCSVCNGAKVIVRPIFNPENISN